mgnify:CR=1 FL=1
MPRLPGDATPRRGLGGWLRAAFHENAGLKFVAFVLAVTLFLLVNTGEDREIGATIRVAYTLPDDKVLVSPRLDGVRVTLRGSWRRIKHFVEAELEPIEVDLRGMESGEYPLRPDMVRVPSGLTLTSISPSVIRVDFARVAVKTVPVTVATAGRPLHGFHVVEARANPAMVAVRGAAPAIAALSTVRTREIRIDDRSASFDTVGELVTPEPHVELLPADAVSVTIEIEAEDLAQEVGPLAVEARVGEGEDPALARRLEITPSEVTVVLRGRRLAVEELLARGVVPVVWIYAEEPGGKPRRKTVEILDAPPGVGVEVTPRQVMVKAARR